MLYKYVSAERVVDCLPEKGYGTLRATQPSALNDPFECAVDTAGAEMSAENLSTFLTAVNCTTLVSPSAVNDAKKRHGSLYVNQILSDQLSQRFGIVSFTKQRNHPLMWAHYTIDGSGFVIGYDEEQIGALGEKYALGEVKYLRRPKFRIQEMGLSEANLQTLFFCKSCYWDYEKEWRLIVELDKAIGTGKKDARNKPIYLVPVPASSVGAVYYTERTPIDVVNEVERRLGSSDSKYGIDSPVKLVLDKSNYGYEPSHG